MFRASTAAALLAAALAVQGACVVPACAAQGRADAQAGAPASASVEAMPGNAMLADDAPRDAREDSRSAFGKVMGLMIGALQHQSRQRAHAGRTVRTTAIGTPLDIEVGAAFLGDAGSPGDSTRKAAPADAEAATTARGVAPPQETAIQPPVLRPVTLAGPE